jgi:hypothetical protein
VWEGDWDVWDVDIEGDGNVHSEDIERVIVGGLRNNVGGDECEVEQADSPY